MQEGSEAGRKLGVPDAIEQILGSTFEGFKIIECTSSYSSASGAGSEFVSTAFCLSFIVVISA
jgi:hypothetical protein